MSEWRNIVDVSYVADCTVGLKKDGTVVAVGDNRYGQCNVSGWRNIDIVEVSCGGSHIVGLKKTVQLSLWAITNMDSAMCRGGEM